MATLSRWCRACGAENRPDANSCYFCGKSLVASDSKHQVPPQQQPKNFTSQQKKIYNSSRKSILNWRSSRLFIILLIIFVILIGVGVMGIYFLNRASADVTIIWQSSPASFTQQDKQGIQDGLKSELIAANPGTIVGHEFTIIDAKRQGDWAIFSASERASQDAQPIPTEPLFFLAHQQGTTWTVWLPSSPNFCDQLMQVPDTLLDTTDKGYFC